MTVPAGPQVRPHWLRLRYWLAGVVGLALLAGAIVWQTGGRAPSGFPGIGGPFALTAQNGATVTQASLSGKPTLLFFGYTHCPDVCPTTLFQLSELLRAMGPSAAVNAAMITVDPERDTAAVMAEYMSSFDPRILGLTGDRAATDAVLKEYRVYAKKVPGKDGDYSMDHSALVYLMDKRGAFVSAFNLDRPEAENIAQLHKMM